MAENQALKVTVKVAKKELRSTELGKEVLGRYTSKKELNRLAHFYIENHLTPTGNERFKTCGNYFEFLTNYELSVKKVHKASNCGNRFCPICTWNMAKKDAMKISVLMKAIRLEEGQEFLMLTLTAPNCSSVELKSEIDRFNLAFKNLMKRQAVKKAVNGYIRKLEVTTDQEPTITQELYKRKQNYFDKRGLKVDDSNPQYNTYNPHFHAILAVNKSYFTSRDYINHDEWLSIWQECMDDTSITQVDIRKVRSSEKSENGAVLEIAKYSAKGNELYHSQAVFDTFYRALKGRQLLTYNGLFKEYVKKYKNGELDKYKVADENEYTHLMQSIWKNSQYENVLRKLSKKEFEEFNKLAKTIDECDEID